MSKKILVVDDEKMIVKGLKFSLMQEDGWEVDCAYDGGEAVEMAKNCEYDMVLLDLMLPVYDGTQVCSLIREFSDMPIIMLTAKNQDMDKIMGLEFGADDYITKPFNVLEVKARMKAIMRRAGKSEKKAETKDSVIIAGGLVLDKESRTVSVDGESIDLTAKEFDLLELFVTNPGKVYSREKLLNLVWGYDINVPGEVRTVDVHVRRLREKIEKTPSEPNYVQTKWGVGYFFKAQ